VVQIKFAEKIKTHILRSVTCFFDIRAVCETWRKFIEPYRPQMIMWRMRIVGWILKAKNTHSEYVILVNFP